MVLHLVEEKLLHLPVLYLERFHQSHALSLLGPNPTFVSPRAK